jgi:transcription elongation factor Elf1
MAELKEVKIRGRSVYINKTCPHKKTERTILKNDLDNKFNSCALCAAEAAAQVPGGLTYEEISGLMGYSNMYIHVIEKKAIEKIKEYYENEDEEGRKKLIGAYGYDTSR